MVTAPRNCLIMMSSMACRLQRTAVGAERHARPLRRSVVVSLLRRRGVRVEPDTPGHAWPPDADRYSFRVYTQSIYGWASPAATPPSPAPSPRPGRLTAHRPDKGVASSSGSRRPDTRRRTSTSNRWTRTNQPGPAAGSQPGSPRYPTLNVPPHIETLRHAFTASAIDHYKRA